MTNGATPDLTPVLGLVSTAVAWLDKANGRSEQEITLRVLKVAEEAGEAVGAWIGVTGQNPRKGVTHTREDVAGELCDVVITALVAVASLGGGAEAALQKMLRRSPDVALHSEDPAETLLILVHKTGWASLAHISGDEGTTILHLTEVVYYAFTAVRALNLDPAQVLTEKARQVSARIAEQEAAR